MSKLNYTIIPILALFLNSCGLHKNQGTTKPESNEIVYFYTHDSYLSDDKEVVVTDLNNVQEEGKSSPRKLVYSANLYVRVKDVDSTISKIGELAKKNGGYVTNISNQQITFRVKNSLFESTIQEVTKLGFVERKNISVEDISDEYLDYEIRLENANKARKRYLELLEMATNVEETLLVEKELERLNNLIDLIKGKLNRFDNLETYSTITVKLDEKVKPGILGYIGLGLYKSVKWLFIRN